VERSKARTSSSFAADLNRWLGIMEAYEGGAHAYHATMPTDALRGFRDTMAEMRAFGFDRLSEAQWEQGRRVRAMLADRGVRSVAAEGYTAPGVVVSYTDDPAIQTGKPFAELGVQIAAGVPLMCDEGEGFRSFRIGLFGIDKLADVDASVARLEAALDRVLPG
jgi:aspartate aminotransferase-like enzyme